VFDVVPLVSTETGLTMERDIVQFVPFSDFKDKSYLELARATLDEIPREVTSFFGSRNCAPKGANEQQAAARTSTEYSGYERPAWLETSKDRIATNAVTHGYIRDEVDTVLSEGLPASTMECMVDTLSHGRRGLGGPFAVALLDNPLSSLLSDKATDVKISKLVRTGTSGDWGKQVESRDGPSAPVDETAVKQQVQVDKISSQKQKGKKVRKGKDDEDIDTFCKVCFEKQIDTVILECGHQVVCSECSNDIGALCPLCRQTISRIVKTFAG
jgi:hypothetical protein